VQLFFLTLICALLQRILACLCVHGHFWAICIKLQREYTSVQYSVS